MVGPIQEELYSHLRLVGFLRSDHDFSLAFRFLDPHNLLEHLKLLFELWLFADDPR